MMMITIRTNLKIAMNDFVTREPKQEPESLSYICL
jgi:hypothetical protein